MIFDKLENLKQYLCQSDMDLLAPVLATITPDCTEGRYEVDGERMFIRVMGYDAKPKADCKVEAHDCYVDIQSTLIGCEGIGIYCRDQLIVSEPYNAAEDVAFYHPDIGAELVDIAVKEGYFAMLFPHEAHSPKELVNDEMPWIKKFVIKRKQR